ncbi:hypothetical protein BKA65DRAFT_241417 [Rhexocercosporidium sp. MPI-PUGE-AT-0058]|nr:hypothetical protein BKA65DRAFT_241417 [Rhexocercosporidium sp. MPI-PUGE-AT-0058]
MDEIGTNSVPALPQQIHLEVESNRITLQTDDLVSRPAGLPGLRRKEITNEQWEELKPLIRRLYLDENMTREAVTKFIVQEYNFEPTKRQFLRKISKWGFEKNVRKAERKAILLDSATNQSAFEVRTVHGRKLDKAKMERWSKRDRIPLQHQELEKNKMEGIQFSTTRKIVDTNVDDAPSFDRDAESDAQTTHLPDGEEMDIDPQFQHINRNPTQDLFNPWTMVDIINSPKLTGLLGALAIYECDSLALDLSPGVPDLEDVFEVVEVTNELNALEGVSHSITSTEILPFRSPTPKQIFPIIPKWATQNKPSIGISPFPKSSPSAKPPSPDFSGFERPPRFSESECEAKMRRLKRMEPIDVLFLVDSMWSIATHYYRRRHYRSAEHWYRWIVTAKLQVRHQRQHETIKACLCVVACIDYQGRYADARAIHQDLHEKILRLFESTPDHELTLNSRERLARLLASFGEWQQEEATRREILQAALNKNGIADSQCLEMMYMLASCLSRLKRYPQAEQLFRTSLHLGTQAQAHSPSDEHNRIKRLKLQIKLVEILNETGRYSEAKTLLQHIREKYSDLIAIDHSIYFEYYSALANTQRHSGRLDESENIFQDLLHRQEAFLTPSKRCDLMLKLAKIAHETGREREALSWYRKRFILEVDAYGIEHKYSLKSCIYLGYYYAKQGLFDDAISHFEQTISMIELLRKEGDGAPKESIDKIWGWMTRVITDKYEATGFDFVNRGLFEEAILHFLKAKAHLAGVEREDSYARLESSESIERIQRCISYVVEDQMAECMKLGFDYAERGLFDDAILHFHHTITKIAAFEDDHGSTGEYDGCTEKIRGWLSTTYALKSLDECKQIGMGYADEGHFDKAIQYFQQAIDGIDYTKESGSFDPNECVKILQDWIQQVEQEKATSLDERMSEQASDISGEDTVMPEVPSNSTG